MGYGPQRAHRAAVARLIAEYPRVEESGFARALADVRRHHGRFGRWKPVLRPDAYAVVPEQRSLYAFEVEITNHVSDAKFDDYAELWTDFLAPIEWDLILVLVDRYGRPSIVYDMGEVMTDGLIEWLREGWIAAGSPPLVGRGKHPAPGAG